MNNITDQELLSQYVLVSKEEYAESVKAQQMIKMIGEILDHAGKYKIPNLVRMVVGKETIEDD